MNDFDMTKRKTFDYVIVGAGSAGCVLAHRLTESGSHRVLLLEAGGWDWDPWIHIPLGWGRIYNNRLHDWKYTAEPADSLGGRRLEFARGKVIGGCSSVNALAYVRGNPKDYDRWAAQGLPEWSYAHVLPYFKRQETWEGGESEYRGGNGPLRTQYWRYDDPLAGGFICAAAQMGFPIVEDYNAEHQLGFGRAQQTVAEGRRCSAATAYLRPALHRPNLTVCTHAHATRLLMTGDRAIGAEYSRFGRLVRVEAEREVILAGGVINSPQLLNLSGIGAPEDLCAANVQPRVALSGVGQGLQDHLTTGIAFRRKGTGPLAHNMRLDRIVPSLFQAYFSGTGFAANLPGGCHGFVKTRPGLDVPDVQFLFRFAPAEAAPYLPPFRSQFPDGFSIRAVILHPESRGTVTLRSADPFQAPTIRQEFLTNEAEWDAMRRGIEIARDLGRQSAMGDLVRGEIAPGRLDRKALDDYIRRTAWTSHHPVGTCRMGSADDPRAVTDAQLRVRGVQGLRVVDASVMPDLISGNTNASVMMIAERASDLILGRPGLSSQERRSEPRAVAM